MKLLLIEDNAAMQTTLRRSFERRGMQVLGCDDGARALALWQASLPDAVLLDLSLPGQDGLEVLAQARAAGLRTPVIILTARGTVGDRILGLNTGADDYLPKPFDLDELEARIQALLRRRSPQVQCSTNTLAVHDAASGDHGDFHRAYDHARQRQRARAAVVRGGRVQGRLRQPQPARQAQQVTPLLRAGPLSGRSRPTRTSP